MENPQWALDICKDVFPIYSNHLEIGMITQHPDGRTVKIMAGQFLDPIYGRLSNFWFWREVLPDGTLGDQEEGYGWQPILLESERRTE